MNKNLFYFLIFLVEIVPYWHVQAKMDTTNINPIVKTSIPYSKVSLETKVNEQSIPLNKELIFELLVNWEGDPDIFQFDILPNLNFENLEMKGSKVSNLMSPQDDHFIGTKTFTYIFKPIKQGKAYIEPISVNYYLLYETTGTNKKLGSPHTLETQKVIIGILSPNFEMQGLIIPGIILVGVGILSLGGIFLWKKKRKKLEKIEFPQKSPFEIQTDALLKLIDCEHENCSEQFSKISCLIKEIYKEKYSLSRTYSHTPDFLKQLDNIAPSEKEICKEILEFCDTLKYATVNMVNKDEIKNMLEKIKITFLKT